MTTQSPQKKPADRSKGWKAYASVAAFLTANNLVYNTLFIILGSLATLRGYDEKQIGILGSAFLFGQMAANLTGVYWVKKINWHAAVAASTIACSIAIGIGAFVSYLPLVISFVFAGAMTGVSLSCLFCHISGMQNPVRAYSISLISQCLVAGTLVVALQFYILPVFGVVGLSLTISIVFLLTLFALPFIPSGSHTLTQNLPQTTSNRHLSEISKLAFLPSLGLVGIAIYFIGQTGIWAFMERIGTAKGLSPDFIAQATALVLILCAVGAFASDRTGNRLGVFTPIAIGMVLFACSMVGLMISNGAIVYFVSLLVYASAWNYLLPYQLLMVSQGDKNSSYAAVIPAFQSIGATIGPASVGYLVVDSGGYLSVYVLAIATAIMSLATFACISALRRRNPNIIPKETPES